MGFFFLSSSSKAFLGPIYPNSIDIAQYSGVCQAASIVHDEHIGIGKHYHLYRLPDAIERDHFLSTYRRMKYSNNISALPEDQRHSDLKDSKNWVKRLLKNQMVLFLLVNTLIINWTH